jgi:hypothetical protein
MESLSLLTVFTLVFERYQGHTVCAPSMLLWEEVLSNSAISTVQVFGKIGKQPFGVTLQRKGEGPPKLHA